MQPFRDVFQRYELLFYLTVRAGQIGMKVAHVPVQRRYPANAATPTKITGIAAKFDVLKQTLSAALGRMPAKMSLPGTVGICFNIEHRVQRLLHRSSDHLAEVVADPGLLMT